MLGARWSLLRALRIERCNHGGSRLSGRRIPSAATLRLFAVPYILGVRCLLCRLFTSVSRKRSHLELTAEQTRQRMLYAAKIIAIDQPSDVIKTLRLKVQQPGLSFKPGQWVDFYVPDVPEVAGYSMTSSPHEASELGEFELAVRKTDFPTTRWVHETCKVGDVVHVRVGGDFFYELDPNRKPEPNLLLMGGGVGINPMVSIARYYRHLKDSSNPLAPGRLCILYSAQRESDLIYKEVFSDIQNVCDATLCDYFVTREKKPVDSPPIHYRRIEADDLSKALGYLGEGGAPVVCYICGPPSMIDCMALALKELKVPENRIRFERWT